VCIYAPASRPAGSPPPPGCAQVATSAVRGPADVAGAAGAKARGYGPGALVRERLDGLELAGRLHALARTRVAFQRERPARFVSASWKRRRPDRSGAARPVPPRGIARAAAERLVAGDGLRTPGRRARRSTGRARTQADRVSDDDELWAQPGGWAVPATRRHPKPCARKSSRNPGCARAWSSSRRSETTGSARATGPPLFRSWKAFFICETPRGGEALPALRAGRGGILRPECTRAADVDRSQHAATVHRFYERHRGQVLRPSSTRTASPYQRVAGRIDWNAGAHHGRAAHCQ
jgi:hypothetical protein